MNAPLQADSGYHIHAVNLHHGKILSASNFSLPIFPTENIVYNYMLQDVDTGWVNNDNPIL